MTRVLSEESKGYRLYKPMSKKVVIKKDIVFDRGR